jgi:DNA-binding FadR family transcriptional regulator
MFYLSCRELGERLQVSRTNGFETLRDLTQDGVLKVERAGTQGENGRTTVYKWMFSYKQLSAAV